MIRKVTAKGGPLHGKSYSVHANLAEFPPPPGSKPGRYRVTEKQAIWEPASNTKSSAPGDTDSPGDAD